ncbi:MAG: hypothetical protein JWP35_2163 [Caulobacter sp.]|nr:hypothetical protein [Caulobacter sp.]
MTDADFDDLMAQAFDLIDNDEFDKALQIGRDLEARQFSGGFEVQALALSAQDKSEEAMAVLERGVAIAPVWLLWQMLGNLRSDAGRCDEALDAYRAAAKLPGADTISLDYNWAHALSRAERLGEAETRLLPLLKPGALDGADPHLRLLIWTTHADLLNAQARPADAFAFVDSLTFGDDDDSYPEERASIEAERAVALTVLGPPDAAEASALKAIGYDKSCETAQWVLREIRADADASNAKYMRVMVEGRWHASLEDEGGDTPPGFFATYEVMADDEIEALAFIKEFEPPAVRDSLVVSECEVLASPEQPKGVYLAAPGYAFFSEDEA